MSDYVFESWLEGQFAEGMRLAEESDLLTLTPTAGSPPYRYRADYCCRGLVRTESGEIAEADDFGVGLRFAETYLRVADPAAVLTWLHPNDACRPWHPNVSEWARFICIGPIAPGTSLVSLLHRVFELITYNRVATHDVLNPAAAAWARANQARFPLDTRPMKRRADFDFGVLVTEP